ncbi:MAG: response regulator [Candidatus Aminicenantes bacterium]|nr:response regulator [Candidatus Aminicenantes bacterium]
MSEKKILVVDFDANSLESSKSLFESHGLKVVTARDGEAGYDMFKKEKPDLVILEAMIPKLHGFDLTQKICQDSKGQVPVIIVTGVYKGSQYRNEALRFLGAAEYFEKPFNTDKLVDVVLNLLYDETEIRMDLPSKEKVLETLKEMLEKT